MTTVMIVTTLEQLKDKATTKDLNGYGYMVITCQLTQPSTLDIPITSSAIMLIISIIYLLTIGYHYLKSPMLMAITTISHPLLRLGRLLLFYRLCILISLISKLIEEGRVKVPIISIKYNNNHDKTLSYSIILYFIYNLFITMNLVNSSYFLFSI